MTNFDSVVTTEVFEKLDSADVARVSQLLGEATAFDGVRPLSEHAWLHLDSNESGLHVLGFLNNEFSAYAHVDTTDLVAGTSAELIVSPLARSHGLGRALVQRTLELSPDGRLRLWAHSSTAEAQSLADSLGFLLNRSLWEMRRSLFAPLPTAQIPRGVQIRAFDPLTDIPGVLAINARAFTDLHDQGSWTERDIAVRLGESWFRADGFFIAVDSHTEDIIGFHWTKVHGSGQRGSDHSHEAIGEVYVIAVDPIRRIPGLGRALTTLGLTYLRELGLRQAMLYVDFSNERAISLYESLGFVHWDTDVMFGRPRD
ncbi:MAG: mycothiol synthase [Candidatus Nanopelagicales bacterium]|nr:mycothiol synthase [Candidatus Nanopelagicales bacterium]